MICPNCGHSTPPGRTRCGQCNYKLPETAVPQASATGEALSVPCWNCSQPNSEHATRCTHCNTKSPGDNYPRRPIHPTRLSSGSSAPAGHREQAQYASHDR